ncbi:hypothetical protein [Nostoc linckia]|nr:hypothetical protein [Nostoc linckia]
MGHGAWGMGHRAWGMGDEGGRGAGENNNSPVNSQQSRLRLRSALTRSEVVPLPSGTLRVAATIGEGQHSTYPMPNAQCPMPNAQCPIKLGHVF